MKTLKKSLITFFALFGGSLLLSSCMMPFVPPTVSSSSETPVSSSEESSSESSSSSEDSSSSSQDVPSSSEDGSSSAGDPIDNKEVKSLIEMGQYYDALMLLKENEYIDEETLYTLANAGISFLKSEYVNGIDLMASLNAPTHISYTADGAQMDISEETLYFNPINNKAYKEGYTFNYWQVSDVYIDPYEISASINLNAVFQEEIYHITYDLNGGTTNETLLEQYNIHTTFTLPHLNKERCEFLGWTRDGEVEPKLDYTIEKGTTGDLHFIAHFSEEKYTLTINTKGGELEQTKYVFTYGESYSIPTPNKEGYIFSHYQIKFSDEVFPLTGTWTYEKDLTIEAVWNAKGNIPYTVKHVFEPLPNEESEVITETFVGSTGECVHPSYMHRKGFSPDEVVKELIITADGLAEVTFYYTRVISNVSFVLNGGTLNNKNIQIKYGFPYELETPIKPGFEFVGYYYDGQEVPISGYWEYDYDVSLIAEWNASSSIPYTINYHLENLDGTYETHSEIGYGPYGEVITVYPKEFEGFGTYSVPEYVFLEHDGTAVVDFYYYRLSYEVEYITNSDYYGEQSMSEWVKFGAPLDDCFKPTRNDSVFAGWYLEETLETKALTMPAKGIKVYAAYEGETATNAFFYEHNENSITITGLWIISENVVIPRYIAGKPVKAIADSAFYNCGATTITLPYYLEEIGEYSFACNDKLTRISGFTHLLTVIPNHAFFECPSLVSIDSLEFVTHIGTYAFAGCYSLLTTNIGSDIEYIDSYAFFGCTSYSDDLHLENVTYIGDYAFEGSAIKSIQNLNGAATIGEAIFKACENLSVLTFLFNDTVEEFYIASLFGGVEDIKQELINSVRIVGVDYVPAHFYDGLLIEEYNLALLNVTEIKYSAFANCVNLKIIYLPYELDTVGDGAFFNCSSLREITFKENITHMGSNVFENAHEDLFIFLDRDNIPADWPSDWNSSFIFAARSQTIGGVTYKYDKSTYFVDSVDSEIETVNVKSNIDGFFTVYKISEYAFRGKTNLKIVNIPDSINNIGYHAFMDSENIEEITIPFIGLSPVYFNVENTGLRSSASSIRKITLTVQDIIPDHFLPDFTALEEIHMPNTFDKIGDFAFNNCKSLKQFNIPNSVEYIGELAFNNCLSLTEITIPSSVYVVGDYAFNNLPNTKIIVEGDKKPIGWSEKWTDGQAEVVWLFGTISLNGVLYKINDDDTYSVVGYEEGITTANICYILNQKYVTSIAPEAFKNCSTLVEVIIPYTITSIGESAFMYCSLLKTITFLEGSDITVIEKYTFLGCSSLLEFTIPNNVIEVKEAAFADCISLTTFYFNGNIEVIGERTFANCSSLLDVTVHGTIDVVSNEAFKNCYSLSTLSFGPGVKTIGDEAFANCTSLKEVELSFTIETIGYRAFAFDYALGSIRIPSSVTTIKEEAFFACTYIFIEAEFIEKPANWADNFAPEDARINYLYGTQVINNVIYSYDVYNSSFFVSGYNDGLVDLVVEEFVNGIIVTAINNNAFLNCTTLKTVNIHSSINYIGSGAFKGCTNIEKYIGPMVSEKLDSVNSYIGLESASESLKEVTITVQTSLPRLAFNNFTKLTKVKLPDTLVSIGEGAFMSCTSLEYITLPSSLENIEKRVFANSGIKEIALPEKITVISAELFTGTKSLTKVTCLGEIIRIEDSAFSSSLISEFVIPQTVTEIGSYAFCYCENLISINIPSSVTHIGDWAFAYCSSLISVTFSEDSSLNTINSALFYECKLLTNCTLPSSITRINEYAFTKCASLVNFVIHENVTYIGSLALADTNGLKEVFIPSTVLEMGSCVFGSYPSYKIFVDLECKPEGWADDWVIQTMWVYFIHAIEVENGVKYKLNNTRDAYVVVGAETDQSQIQIVDTHHGFSVTKIDAEAFSYNSTLTEVSIPSSIAAIGNYAFYYCTSLSEIHIPSTVLVMGSNVFSNPTVVYVDLSEKPEGWADDWNGDAKYYFEYETLEIDGVEYMLDNVNNEAIIVSINLYKTIIEIPDEINGYSVKNIYAAPFKDLPNLITLVLPDTIEHIDENTFNGCVSLTNLTAPFIGIDENYGDASSIGLTMDTLMSIKITRQTVIRTLNFVNLDNLKEVILPNNLVEISESAFLTSPIEYIEIPASVTKIGEMAFASCLSLKGVYFAEGSKLTRIEKLTFNNCWNLETINLPSSLSYIADSGFFGCKLTSLDLSNTVIETIEKSAFSGCAIKSITLPDTLKSIGAAAFYSTNIQTITIPSSVEVIGSKAFAWPATIYVDLKAKPEGWADDWYSNATYYFIDGEQCVDGVIYTFSKEFNGYVVSGAINEELSVFTKILSKLETGSVVAVLDNSFANCTNIRSILIPNSITYIGANAFVGCLNIIEVMYRSDTQSWAMIEFGNEFANPMYYGRDFYFEHDDGSHSLVTEIYLYDIDKINNYAFYGFEKITNVYLSDKLEHIGDYAFAYCSSLLQLTINEGVTSVGDYAFAYCSSLTIISIPSTLIEFGYGILLGSNSLKEFRYGGTIEQWMDIDFESEYHAPLFNKNSDVYLKDVNGEWNILKTLIIPETVTDIKKYQFIGFGSVGVIELHNGIKSIAEGVFKDTYIYTVKYYGYINQWCNISFVDSYSSPNYSCMNFYMYNNEGVLTQTNEIVIPDNIEHIGPYQFAGLYSLSSITLGAHTKTIGEGAFYDCYSLKSITIPNYVSTINQYTFAYCNNLEEVHLSEYTQVIDSYAFGACLKLENLYIGNSIQSIKANAFMGTLNLTLIIDKESEPDAFEKDWDKDVKEIIWAQAKQNINNVLYQYDADDNSYSVVGFIEGITSAEIESEINGYPVTKINERAFSGCATLLSLRVPGSITYIGESAFLNCLSLTTVVLEEGVETIANFAFGNNSLSSITLPKSLVNFGVAMFSSASNLYYEGTLEDWLEIPFNENTRLNKVDNLYFKDINGNYDLVDDIVIPASINKLYPAVFENIQSLKTVQLEGNITEISNYAFAYCSKLTTINLDSVNKIGDHAFINTSLRGAFNAGDNLISIGNYAFSSTYLNEVTFSRSLESIGDYAFAYIGHELEIIIPDNIKNIGDNAFLASISNSYRYSISVELATKPAGWHENWYGNANVTWLDAMNFTYSVINNEIEITGPIYSDITHISIPEEIDGYLVTRISDNAFINTSTLLSVKLPNSLTYIGTNAFKSCTQISTFISPFIGNTRTSGGSSNIGLSSTNLSLVEIKDQEVIPANAFKNFNKINKVRLPSNLVTIGSNAFSGCTSLTSITLPPSLETIGDQAFYNCFKLTSITFPKSLKTIGNRAFIFCDALTQFYYDGSLLDWVEIDFSIKNPFTISSSNEFYYKTASGYKLLNHTLELRDLGIEKLNSFTFGFIKNIEVIGLDNTTKYIGSYALPNADVYFNGSISDWVSITFIDQYSNPIRNQSLYLHNIENGTITLVESVQINENINIGSYAFYDYDKLLSVNLGEAVGSVGSYAFSNCNYLTILSMASAIINSYAFYNCVQLRSVTLPAFFNGAIVQEGVFRNCNSLESIDLPRGLESIGDYAFDQCEKLVSVKLPETLKSIGMGSFNNNGFTSIELPYGLESIGPMAFCNSRLTKVDIPITVTIIGVGAFAASSYLETVNVREGVQYIHDYAFQSCYSLKVLNLPSTLIYLGREIFQGASNLTVNINLAKADAGWNESWNYNEYETVINYIGV